MKHADVVPWFSEQGGAFTKSGKLASSFLPSQGIFKHTGVSVDLSLCWFYIFLVYLLPREVFSPGGWVSPGSAAPASRQIGGEQWLGWDSLGKSEQAGLMSWVRG